MNKKQSVATTLVASLPLLLTVPNVFADNIGFEGAVPGTIVDEVMSDDGAGPIGVNAKNVELDAIFLPGPNNAAVIFDSSNPSGGDLDLGTPNEVFFGPGVGTSGASNTVALGNLLIIGEVHTFMDSDGSGAIDSNDMVTEADDADNPNAPITFDFSTIAPVTISSIDLIDIEQTEGNGTVTLFDEANLEIDQFTLPTPGDNGVALAVSLGPTAGVWTMEVVLGGSGAIDNIVFDVPVTGGGQGCTPGYWKQRHHFDSWETYMPGDSFDSVFDVTSSLDGTLLMHLKQGGGGQKALGRHAVAALLNSVGNVSYAFSTTQVISMVQGAYASGNFNSVKDILADENEMGCPLN